eukprot:gene1639-12764_t
MGFNFNYICRHGDRTPAHEFLDLHEHFNCTDEYKNEKCPLGHLTYKGRMQHYQIGNDLRRLYINRESFLSSKYNKYEIEIESTNFSRTITSVKYLMYGLYPFSSNKINFKKKIKIIDDIYPNAGICPKVNEIMKNIKNDLKFINFQKEKENFKKELNLIFKIKELENYWLKLFDIFNCRESHSKELPKGITKEMINEIKSIVEWEWLNYINDKNYLKFGISMFIKRLLSKFKNKIKKKNEKKLIIYSGHDTSIAPILGYFNLYSGEFPNYASNIIFSLFKENDNYFISIHYNFNHQILNFCGNDEFCNFESFKSYINQNSFKKFEFEQKCKS